MKFVTHFYFLSFYSFHSSFFSYIVFSLFSLPLGSMPRCLDVICRNEIVEQAKAGTYVQFFYVTKGSIYFLFFIIIMIIIIIIIIIIIYTFLVTFPCFIPKFIFSFLLFFHYFYISLILFKKIYFVFFSLRCCACEFSGRFQFIFYNFLIKIHYQY